MQICWKWMSAKFLIEILIFRKFEEIPHTQKYENTHWRKKKKSVKREESQTTILIEENQRSIAKENQTCINAEKSKASIPENQLNGDFWAFLSYFSSVFTEKKCSLNHLTIGSYVSVRSSRYEVRGKFREHERCVRVAPGKLPKCFISWWTHSWLMNQLFHNIFNPMEKFFSRGICLLTSWVCTI